MIKNINKIQIGTFTNFFLSLEYETYKSIADAVRKSKKTYSNFYMLSKFFRDNGYVETHKKGLLRLIKLTNKGNSTKKGIIFLNNIMKQSEHQTNFLNLLTNVEFRKYNEEK